MIERVRFAMGDDEDIFFQSEIDMRSLYGKDREYVERVLLEQARRAIGGWLDIRWGRPSRRGDYVEDL